MNLKSKKIKILLMIIVMTIILLMSKSVFGYTVSNPPVSPYLYASNLFCINHNKSWYIENVSGMDPSTREIEYTSKGTTSLEQSVAFAFYNAQQTNNWNAGSLQTVVWASGQFKNEPNYTNILVEYTNTTTTPTYRSTEGARSNQFAQFYYGILQGGKGLNLTMDSSNSKVLVDQVNQTYTVGPYKIDVQTGNLTNATKDAKDILHNELAGVNAQNYPNSVPFATYSLSGINGNNIVFLDKSGNVVSFPNWDEDFYIRFNPNSGITSVNPKIHIHYISGFQSSAIVYEATKGTVKGNVYLGSGVDIVSFNASKYVNSGTIVYRGNNASNKVNVTLISVTPHTVKRQIFDHYDYDPLTGKRTPVYIDVDFVTDFDYEAQVDVPSRLQDVLEFQNVYPIENDVEIDLGVKDIFMELGGNVWQDMPDVKTGDILGNRGTEDIPFAGIQVELFDENNNLVRTTITDANGKYHFSRLSPLLKYYVRFTYNGQIYQSTYYKNNLTGGYSNAKEENRDIFNNKFGTIDSSPQNYKIGNDWHKSYALLSKLRKDNGEFISNGKDSNGKELALTYQDAWNKFLEFTISKGSYYSAYNELEKWLLNDMGVGTTDTTGVITFIKDCMLTASTLVDDPLIQGNALVKYPVYNTFILEDLSNPPSTLNTITLDKIYYYLYTQVSDQSRYVDFGITRREEEELYLQKDVFKATVLVNGKKHDYMYSKKNLNDDGSWSVEVRAADELYNGRYSYTREVRKSEYLYDGTDVGQSDAKNLQVFVTYRIILKNMSQSIYASINEIVDYYDADQYSFDGVLQSNGKYALNAYNNYDSNGNVTETYVNSYIGSDSNGTRLSDVDVSNNTSFADRTLSKDLSNGNYKYSSLYVTGITSPSGNNTLKPGEMAYVYLTFKANVDANTGKVKLDQDLNTGNITIGKRNIAEINGYSTYYGPNAVIPDYLEKDNSRVDTSVSNKTAGIIDTLSNAGSLEETDLTSNGDFRTSTDSEVENRLEMDTDKAPNMKVVISQNDEDTRKLSGYVYEDEKTVTNDKAVVGDGKYQENENKVNGVKVELVELVQNVDENGIFLGSYSGEKVWGTNTYELQNGMLVKTGENNDRYFSGYGLSKVILKGPGILDVSEDDLGKNNGEYSFKSVPAGDFFIRFTYGDSVQTVLTNTDNDVNTLLGQKGLNAKSYNGQDYKATTYQSEISQDTSYNGINGFKNPEEQNYYNTVSEVENNNLPSKNAMYSYNIAESGKVIGASDAKDVYGYREKVNTWSKGDNNIVLNNRAETLASFEKVGTYQYESSEKQKQAQLDMLNALIENTTMVAQTGVIDTEVEYNSKSTEGQGNNNKLPYNIDDIDLGLQERPKAALKLNKEIINFKLVLANGSTLFDTTQSVNNLYYAKHQGHKADYDGYRLRGYVLGNNSKEMPELIQAYLDEELIAGSSIQATYKIDVQNIGEVDYLDKQFYYTGKTAHPLDANWVSKTSANELVDYVSNLSRYDSNYQDVNSNWKVRTANDIIKSTSLNQNGEITIDETKIESDLVNRNYYEEVSTYNTLLTTESLSGDTLPELFDENNSTKSTRLILSAILSLSDNDDFVYNNLTEIVSTSNTQGRRMSYSIVGNQQMADQSLGANASEDTFTNLDLVTPSEIDADSAQRVVILPPTGENKNFVPIILSIIVAGLLVTVCVVLIKKKI